MNTRGAASFAEVAALCWRRPGLLARELAWRWIYGIPALAAVAAACYHIYQLTAGTLQAAGVGQISFGNPYQSAAIVAVVAQILRPVLREIAFWLLPLLGIGWAIAAGVGRNIVFRFYAPGLPWRPAALTCVQVFRVIGLAVTVALWWGSMRWSAAVSTVAGVPNLLVYFVLVAMFTLGFLVIWSLFSWVFSIAPLFLLVEGKSLAVSVRRSFWPGSATGRLVGVNLAVALIRFGLAVFATVLSLLPLAFVSSAQSLALYLWLGAVTVLYMVVSGFFQVVRLAAFVEFWRPAQVLQEPASPPLA